jgi:hypothetical protein
VARTTAIASLVNNWHLSSGPADLHNEERRFESLEQTHCSDVDWVHELRTAYQVGQKEGPMRKILKLTAAAALFAASTAVAMAQVQNPSGAQNPTGDPRPLTPGGADNPAVQKNEPPTNPTPPNAGPPSDTGVTSRPIGPPSDTNTKPGTPSNVEKKSPN